jgi:hypothetical protein
MSSGSSAMARASANAPCHPAGELRGHEALRAAQPDGVQLHHHQVADDRLGQRGVLADREGDVLEDREVAEESAPLEHHPHPAAQRVERGRIQRVDHLPERLDLTGRGT